MLKTDIDSLLKEHIKARNEVGKNAFRYLKGEIALIETREGKALNEERIVKIIRQLVESDEANIKLLPVDDPRQKDFQAEIYLLTCLLPKMLGTGDVKDELNNNPAVIEDIRNCKSDGQATGLAIKFFKTRDLLVEGKTITEVVKELRTQS